MNEPIVKALPDHRVEQLTEDMAEFICTDDVCCLDDETEILPFNSHEGVNLPMVGGHVKLDDPSVDPMLVAAAYD